MNCDRYVLVHGDVSIGMGQINCDECESELLVSDHKPDENEIKFLCNCVDTAVVRLNRVLDDWAIDVENPACNRCGESLKITPVSSGSGVRIETRYVVSCRCSIQGFGVEVSWQTMLHDAWKVDGDKTKWPPITDDLWQYVEANGPCDISEITDEFDINDRGAQLLLAQLERQGKLRSDGAQFMSIDQYRNRANESDGVDGYTMVSDDTDGSDEYSGWFSRILP
jgi:hypothetical protein